MMKMDNIKFKMQSFTEVWKMDNTRLLTENELRKKNGILGKLKIINIY